VIPCRAIALAIPLLFAASLFATPVELVIDTDAGSDDLMAIAFLLARPDVEIQAINVVHGLAHVPRGVENVRKLLALAGKTQIPVHPGATKPLQKTAEFPAPWRATSDRLLADFPAPPASHDEEASVWFGERSLRNSTILALGPLTNLALAIQSGARFGDIWIMGGAVDAPGNLGDGGFFKTDNKKAEWNIFCDPKAADIVFRSGARIHLVPLDATNHVPLEAAFLDQLQHNAVSPAARAVGRLLESERDLIKQGIFFAWDPLAAAAVAEPEILKMRRMQLRVARDGATVRDEQKGSAVDVAVDADAARFKSLYLGTVQ